jgi:hypothetical protein
MPASWLPRVASMSCFPSAPRGLCDWHQHAEQDELCLVADGACRLGHGGAPLEIRGDTLVLFRRGERHGYWNSATQQPHLWVLHFRPDEGLYEDFPRLAARDPAKRVWRLAPERSAAYKGLFLKVLAEHRRRGAGAAAAEAAWLRLLLIAVDRWSGGGEEEVAPTPALADPPLLALWQAINRHACVAGAPPLARLVPGYDALRHRFARVFGASPRRMLADLRLERAMSLLLETDLPVREVSERVGFGRQHEFARAFRRRLGCSPTQWRRRPVPRADR